MSDAIRDIQKRRGRPSTGGRQQGVLVRLPPEQFARLDTWIAQQPDPKPTRPEAIRAMIAATLHLMTEE
jgi:hypothetical protein